MILKIVQNCHNNNRNDQCNQGEQKQIHAYMDTCFMKKVALQCGEEKSGLWSQVESYMEKKN